MQSNGCIFSVKFALFSVKGFFLPRPSSRFWPCVLETKLCLFIRCTISAAATRVCLLSLVFGTRLAGVGEKRSTLKCISVRVFTACGGVSVFHCMRCGFVPLRVRACGASARAGKQNTYRVSLVPLELWSAFPHRVSFAVDHHVSNELKKAAASTSQHCRAKPEPSNEAGLASVSHSCVDLFGFYVCAGRVCRINDDLTFRSCCSRR